MKQIIIVWFLIGFTSANSYIFAQSPKEVTTLLFSAYTVGESNLIKKPIAPHFTNKTKVIYIEGLKEGLRWDGFTLFSDGVAFIKNPRTNLWGAIDTLGNKVLDYKFSFSGDAGIPYFQNGVFPTQGSNFKLEGMVLVDKKGEVVKHFPDVSGFTNFVDGVLVAKRLIVDTKKSTQYRKVFYPRVVYINTKGEYVYPSISFDCPDATGLNIFKPNPFVNGLSAYYDYHKKCWGYINKEGKIIISAQYKVTHNFSDGLAAVMNGNNYWGYINPEGKTVIDFRFSVEPCDFREGIAIVKKREGNYRFCMIDKTGTIVKDNIEAATNFYDGVSMAILPNEGAGFKYVLLHRDLKTEEKLFTKKTLKYFTSIHRDLKIEKDYSTPVHYYYNDGILYKDGDVGGVVAKDMDTFLLHASSFRGPFQNGLAKCEIQPKEGSRVDRPAYINKKGELVIVFEQPEF